MFEKKYSKAFVATRIMDIVKDKIGSGSLTKINDKYSHLHISVTKGMLNDENLLDILESLSRNNTNSKRVWRN